ncbi:MAG: ATP-dependent DNA helicase RecG, partial [Candidatus Shapirobacteria bacterium]|nr:ATP-dependent DNA helicase RecG [Candidatus Shapirobacteria bacterium]
VSFQNIFTRNHKNIQKAVVKDSTGTVPLLWFNQPYLSTTIKKGDVLSFAGTVSEYLGKPTLIAPYSGNYQTGKIIGIYPETKGLSSGWFRKIIGQHLELLLADITDPLPPKFNLLPLHQALTQIHLPTNQSLLEKARLRLSLDEILSVQARSYLQKKQHDLMTPQFVLKPKPLNPFIKALPFTLTKSQKKVWSEIYTDLISTKPTNRLLQGDVGSGKTIIAILACLLAHYNKVSSLIIAPTEILAQQHFATFSTLLNFPVELLTAKTKLTKFSPGTIIIATHAAIYQKKKFADSIGLLIIDEQHKFGVSQRSFLSSPVNPPHTITMTATPIPRTISLTLLGNLDISVIDQLPQYRLPIKTFLVPHAKRPDCYSWLENHIKTTRQQAFIVCPFIEPSETMATVKSAKVEFANLQKNIFPNLKLAIIHGKTDTKSRQKILNDFLNNKINILVTTPIIEVGIDFPNASTIIIQSADRFGLAQLHQLRGRVGRGDQPSFCYLFSESDNNKSKQRLEFLVLHTNGQKIAEFDLKTRGPGEIFSTLQHGFPSLKLASFSDTKLISFSQSVLNLIISKYPKYNLKKLIAAKIPDHHLDN